MDNETREELLGLFRSKFNRAMRYYLETCTRCGVCAEACHVHASTGLLNRQWCRQVTVKELAGNGFTLPCAQ